jgi:prepilin-type processing-associated H-X9-DG protein
MPQTVSDFHPTEDRQPRGRQWVWLLGILAAIILIGAITSFLFLPTLGSRPTSNIIKCASNLCQIGQAVMLYAQGHQGHYPDSFKELLLDEDNPISADVFICPSSKDTDATGATTQAIAEDLDRSGHLSYIYVGRGLTDKTVDENTIVALEPLANHGDAINVLFGDGHVDRFMESRASRIIAMVQSGKLPVTMPAGP